MADETKTWPTRIYLQHGDSPEVPPYHDVYNDDDSVTWCADKIEDADVEYVRADIAADMLAALQDVYANVSSDSADMWCRVSAAIAKATDGLASSENVK